MDTAEHVTMRSRSPRAIALAIALLSTPGLIAQRRPTGGTELAVRVTVTPICTVAVRPGVWSPDDAVDVRCRNLGAMQPPPLVTHATSEIADDAPLSPDSVALVVINF
jgi:hypothetical protein